MAALGGVIDGYMMTGMSSTPESEKCAGDKCTAAFSWTGCQATADKTCVPGTSGSDIITLEFTFNAADKVTAVASTIPDAVLLGAKWPVARQQAVPVVGMLMATFLLSASAIGCYTLGKKHGQAEAS